MYSIFNWTLIIKIYLLSTQTYQAHISCHLNYQGTLIASFPLPLLCERQQRGCETQHRCTIHRKTCLYSLWEQAFATTWVFSLTFPALFSTPRIQRVTDVKDRGALCCTTEKSRQIFCWCNLYLTDSHLRSLDRAFVFFLLARFCFVLAAIGELPIWHF